MMEIQKALNQNAVLVLDEGQAKVAIGKGIGFKARPGEMLAQEAIERLFVLEPEGIKKLQTLLGQIDEKFFFATEDIIGHAEAVLGEKLNPHINIGLCDHIAFAAENIQNHIFVRNKLLKEIEVLYPEEFSIAQWAVDYLKRELDIAYSFDEAGYIAIHIHTARCKNTDNSESIREITIISEIVRLIERELSLSLDGEDYALTYSRLVNHLRLFIQRSQTKGYVGLDQEIMGLVQGKYPESYAISKKIQVLMQQDFHYLVLNEELGYLAIHIERLRMIKK
jgi:beta-glucoside operon transcriptional antiterminator